jgi:hypothetical protein
VQEHRKAFCSIGDKPEVFIKFANGLFNHNNEQITASLHHLAAIKMLQEEMSDASWASKSEEEQKKTQENLSDSESEAANSLRCTNTTLNMMSYISSCPELTEHFMRSELKVSATYGN